MSRDQGHIAFPKFNASRSDPGATPLDFQTGDAFIQLIDGLPYGVVMNALSNTAGMAICATAKSKTEAREQARKMLETIERSIDINWDMMQQSKADPR